MLDLFKVQTKQFEMKLINWCARLVLGSEPLYESSWWPVLSWSKPVWPVPRVHLQMDQKCTVGKLWGSIGHFYGHNSFEFKEKGPVMNGSAGSDVFVPCPADCLTWQVTDEWLLSDYNQERIKTNPLLRAKMPEPFLYRTQANYSRPTLWWCRDEWVSCQHCMQHGWIDDLIILLCSWYTLCQPYCVHMCGESILFPFYYYDVTPGGMTYQKVSGSWFSRPRLLSCCTLGQIISLHSAPLIKHENDAKFLPAYWFGFESLKFWFEKDNQTGWEKIITVLAMTFLKLWFFVVGAVIDVYHTICFKIVWKNILYDILQYLSLFLFPSAHSFSCSILDENKVQDLASLFAASILMDFWTKWYFKSILRILLLYKLCIYYFYSICCVIHKSCPEC